MQAFAIQLFGLATLTLAAPAPQVFTQVHAVPAAAGQFNVRAIPTSIQSVRALPSAVSHSHSTITHETPSHSLVRAFAQRPVATAVRAVSNTPTFLRTASVAQPVVHTVNHADHADHAVVRAVQPTFVRTAAGGQQFVQGLAEPTFVRAVSQPQLVHAVHAAEPSVVRTVPVVDQVVGGHAHYSYGYSVNDASSGDLKAREETRDGDVVQGSYTVADPDGRIRHVEYTADRDHGFQARVTYDGEPGPVSLGGPARVTAVAPVATDAGVATDATDAVVIAGRATVDGVQTLDTLPTLVRTDAVRAVPVNSNILRTVPVSNAANILRTVPATATNIFRTVPATSASNVFRTVPAANLIRTVPTTSSTDVFRTVPATTATNVFRTVPTNDLFRTVPTTTSTDAFRTVPATTATVVRDNTETPLFRTQLLQELPAGTQIVRDGQIVRALQSHVITHA